MIGKQISFPLLFLKLLARCRDQEVTRSLLPLVQASDASLCSSLDSRCYGGGKDIIENPSLMSKVRKILQQNQFYRTSNMF